VEFHQGSSYPSTITSQNSLSTKRLLSEISLPARAYRRKEGLTMTIYSTVVFIHVISAIGLFVALTAEGAILFRIRTVQNLAEARLFIRAFQRLRIIAIPSFLGILVGGLYLASNWGGGTFWIPFALGATLLIMLIGGLVTGRRVTRLEKALSSTENDVSVEALSAIKKDTALLLSYGLRGGLGLGIVFLMTAKPDLLGSLGALVAGCGAGLLGATWMRRTSNRIGTVGCPWSEARRLKMAQARLEEARS
jgi:hypothetical protein